jgi:hypothetical protein
MHQCINTNITLDLNKSSLAFSCEVKKLNKESLGTNRFITSVDVCVGFKN